MTTVAYLNEIFSSLQGEGTHVGEKMTFVRFAGCHLTCQWCDTDNVLKNTCTIYKDGSEGATRTVVNPIGIVQLLDIVYEFDDKVVAITGGEPLEQVDFLASALPPLSQKRKILLETAGVHYGALKKIVPYVDIISMDIKLPSSTAMTPFWSQHREFIDVVLQSGKEFYIKLIVTGGTSDKDIHSAIKLISGRNKYVPVILQPVSATDEFATLISEDQILSFKRLIGAWLPNVSIVPQMHKEWGVK